MWFDIKTNESKLVTLLVIILALVGLIIIYFAVMNIKPLDIKINSIENSMTGRLVKINGRIDNIRKSKSGNSYWAINDGGSITVPILDNKFKKLIPKRGDIVEIVGLVTKYNEEFEVMPKEIYIKQSDDLGET